MARTASPLPYLLEAFPWGHSLPSAVAGATEYSGRMGLVPRYFEHLGPARHHASTPLHLLAAAPKALYTGCLTMTCISHTMKDKESRSEEGFIYHTRIYN